MSGGLDIPVALDFGRKNSERNFHTLGILVLTRLWRGYSTSSVGDIPSYYTT